MFVHASSSVFNLLVFGVAERKSNELRQYNESMHTAGSADNLLFVQIVLKVCASRREDD